MNVAALGILSGFLTVNVHLQNYKTNAGFLCHPGRASNAAEIAFIWQATAMHCAHYTVPWYCCTYTGWLSGGAKACTHCPHRCFFKVGSRDCLRVLWWDRYFNFTFLSCRSAQWGRYYDGVLITYNISCHPLTATHLWSVVNFRIFLIWGPGPSSSSRDLGSHCIPLLMWRCLINLSPLDTYPTIWTHAHTQTHIHFMGWWSSSRLLVSLHAVTPTLRGFRICFRCEGSRNDDTLENWLY